MEEYRIEQFPQSKNEEKIEQLLSFCRRHLRSAFNVKQRLAVNTTIDYARKIYSSEKGKAYYGTAEDDFEYDDSGRVRGTKRFSSKMVTLKIDEAASIITDERPKVYIEIAAVAPKLEPGKSQEQLEAEFNQKLADFGGVVGLKETMQACLDNWWDRQEMDIGCRNIVICSLRDKNAILSTYFDPELSDGDGDVVLMPLDPKNYIPEPGLQRREDMRYEFYIRRLDRARAEDEYGDVVKDAQSNESEYEGNQNDKKTDRGEVGQDDLIIINSYWRDNTTESVVLDDESGEKEEIPLYPNGRIISWCGNTLLEDRANDLPFRQWESLALTPDPGNFWGRSMAIEIAPAQENFDKCVQMAMENLFICGNMTTYLKEGVIPLEKQTDIPGGVIEVDINRDMREIMERVNPQVVARDCYELMNVFGKTADDISAVHPTAEGQRPKSVQSGRAIISLQEATNRFMRNKARNFEIVLKKCMEKAVYLIYKNYKKGRLYTKSLEGQKTFSELPLDFDEFNIIFKISIAPGSSLPKDKESLANLAMSLYQMNPMEWPAEFVNEKLELGPELKKSLQQEYEMIKQKVMQKMQTTGGNPQAIAGLIQSGEIPAQLMQAVMQDFQNQQAQAQQRTGGGQGQMPAAQPQTRQFIGQ